MTSASDSARPKRRSQSTAMTGKTARRRRAPGLPAPTITHGNPLQLLLAQRIRELGERDQGAQLSYQQVVDRGADRRGRPRFSKATFGNILNGKTTRLTDPVIEALAQALEVDEDTVRQAAKQASTTKMELPARVRRLSPEAWEKLLSYADYLLAEDGSRGPRR